jgi:DNA recombination protein RmuC
MSVELAGIALAVIAAIVALLVVLRQGRELQHLRLLTEQAREGTRTEGETTRAHLRAQATEEVERLMRLSGTLDTSLEKVRTVLTGGQGELRLALASQIVEQFNTTREMLESKLKELREGNEGKLAEIQKSVNEQLHAAVEKQMNESFNRVIDQFTAVQKAMGDVQAVTAQIGDIKRLFSNVRTRGGWGETQVRAMLDDILPAGEYEMNCKVHPDSNDVVEFAVKMPVRGESRPLLAIDAKFPVEDYERLLTASEAGDTDAERSATRMLERRMRDEARKIATKYINPPVTVEFAVLYLPTDALYAEVARIAGLIDEIGRECRVLIMGPSLFPALLRTIHLGFITLALEQKADQIGKLLGATKQEMQRMDVVLARLAKQAGGFTNTIESARRRTRAVSRVLRSVEAVEGTTTDRLLEEEARVVEEPEEGEDA